MTMHYCTVCGFSSCKTGVDFHCMGTLSKVTVVFTVLVKVIRPMIIETVLTSDITFELDVNDFNDEVLKVEIYLFIWFL